MGKKESFGGNGWFAGEAQAKLFKMEPVFIVDSKGLVPYLSATGVSL